MVDTGEFAPVQGNGVAPVGIPVRNGKRLSRNITNRGAYGYRRSLFLSAPLPAPLYYLNETGQIWRVVGAPPEYILAQVTQEAVPITDFTISPVHGRLVYVTDDYRDLIEFDPVTQQRVVKLADLDRSLPPNGIDWHTKLRAPRYSSDGTQISFAYKGIFLIASGLHSSAEPALLQADNYSLDMDQPDGSVYHLSIQGHHLQWGAAQ